MGDLNTYKSKLQELTALIEKLENGKLTIDELSRMEELTRKLHERSIILKYKAFESHAGVEVTKEVQEEKTPEPVAEEPEPEEETSIDFDIFEEEEELPTKEEVEEEIDFMNDEEDDTEAEPEPEVAAAPEVEEHVSVTHTEEIKDDVIESKVEVTHTKESKSFLDRIDFEDNSLASQYAGGKLDSLIGAFGLNQRLSFINNLFDGSSELFSDAIKVLDSQNSIDEAAAKAEAMATEHDWDLEEENVLEFMTYLKRRYA